MAPSARSSSTELAPASVSIPILERRRRATNLPHPARVTLLNREAAAREAATREVVARQEPRSWDRARWVNEVRRFDTAWDVDAPRSGPRATMLDGALPVRAKPAPLEVAPTSVTLVVYEWQNAEPGTLSWQFPTLPAAVAAARAMRNAVRWAVVAGSEPNLGVARAHGLILAEAESGPQLPKI